MWIKQGNIFPEHAQLPTPVQIGDDLYVYFSYRINGKSHIGLVIFDKRFHIMEISHNILGPGERGCFDDSGVMPSCIIDDYTKEYQMYYSGWNCNKGGVPYGHGIGMAYSADGIKFSRAYEGPILDRTVDTPFLANSPFVLDRSMYFCNGCGWDGDFPKYFVAVASYVSYSNWSYREKLFGKTDEANSRPWVIREDGKTKIWSAMKTKSTPYRIRYWEDGIVKDHNVLPASETGWDSEMICYPAVIDFHGQRVMLYNGNGYGATGIGLATL